MGYRWGNGGLTVFTGEERASARGGMGSSWCGVCSLEVCVDRSMDRLCWKQTFNLTGRVSRHGDLQGVSGYAAGRACFIQGWYVGPCVVASETTGSSRAGCERPQERDNIHGDAPGVVVLRDSTTRDECLPMRRSSVFHRGPEFGASSNGLFRNRRRTAGFFTGTWTGNVNRGDANWSVLAAEQ